MSVPSFRRWHALAFTLLAATPLSGPRTLHADDLEITYLANEGFLIRAGETMVLIDALFGEGIHGYTSLDESTRRHLEAAEPPWDGVDLVLASHLHGDHFNARAVRRFLTANPRVHFVSTDDAASKVLAGAAPDLADRIHGHWPSEGTTERFRTTGVEVTIFNLHHGRSQPEVQNLGLLLRICGTTVLHIGDTEADAADLRAAGLVDLRPDVGLLPSWFLRPSRWTDATTSVIAPREIVAMHLPASDAPAYYFYGGASNLSELEELIRGRFPDAWIPTEQGDSRRFACRVP